ncbi:DUF6493 family protein [Nocardioides lijunqiniae]|uniref:DUF6493 family protein n=1 Tax=Nocardioides lijunqiniae TaxID=2760832 RepID=UPI00187879A5|nr:DUF6493 family protein [Nocardioides lijunqiniae]
MSAPTMEELLRLVAAVDLAPLVARLDDLDDATRKKLAKPVRELARSGEWGDPPRHLARGLSLLGPAVLPDARATAAWIRRSAGWRHSFDERSFDQPGNRIETLSPTSALVVEVLLRRDPSWLPALVRELADRLRFDRYNPDDYLLIERLRSRAGLPPPAVPVFAAMWVRTAWRSRRNEVDAVALVRAEPAYAELVPLAFEVDEIAGEMRHRDQLRRLADSGTVDRGVLLDALVARLQRGGRPQATNEFVRDLESLAPTLEEVAARTRDHLALLPPGSATSVATLAQHHLLELHSEGRLSPDEVLEMSRSVLARTEKKLLRAQLAHLQAHADAHPADADLSARAVSMALDNAAPDIQRKAVDLLNRLAPRLTPATAALIAAAGDALPSDLRQRLITSLGTPAPKPEAPLPQVELPPPPNPPGPVVPIETVEELVEELASILHSEPLAARGADLDRVVEALPRLGLLDREALRRAAAPVTSAGTYRYYQEHARHLDFTLRGALVALLASCLGDSRVPQATGSGGRLGAPARACCVRIFALADSVRQDPLVRVVALPSQVNGTIAANDLHTRLADAAAQSWSPDPVDLEQALLRLDLAGTQSEPFAALGSAAGRQVSEWVRAGGHRPPTIQVARAREYLDTLNMGSEERAAAKPRSSPMAEVRAAVNDPLSLGPLWSELARWSVPSGGLTVGWAPDDPFETWPLVLPHHPELVAAHLLPELSRARQTRSQGAAALVSLTETADTVGPALLLGLAYLTGGKHQEAWSAATDALLILASRHQLDAQAFGEVLAMMLERGDLVAKRLIIGLGDAARGGAAGEIWTALSHVLSHLLRGARTVVGVVDLLVLAAEVALLTGAQGAIDGLDDLASRTGRTRQVVEARRLLKILDQLPTAR